MFHTTVAASLGNHLQINTNSNMPVAMNENLAH